MLVQVKQLLKIFVKGGLRRWNICEQSTFYLCYPLLILEGSNIGAKAPLTGYKCRRLDPSGAYMQDHRVQIKWSSRNKKQ